METRVSDPRGRRLTSVLVFAVIAVLAIYSGQMAAEGPEGIGFFAALALAGLALFRYLGLPAWMSFVLIAPVLARGVRTALGLPPSADFVHYPIVLGFALAALSRPQQASSRTPRRWLGVFLLVTLISAVAHPTNPVRTLLFLFIAGEPLVIIWAVTRWSVDQRSIRILGWVAAILAAVQIPFALYQGLTYGWSDPVVGTLTGHGAGAHVFGALFALGFLVVVAAITSRHLNPLVGGIAAVVCLAMMLAASAIAVLLVATVAAILVPVIWAPRAVGRRKNRRVSSFLIAACLSVFVFSFVSGLVPGIYDRVAGLATASQFPEIGMVKERASDRLALILGSGPGTSASRASLLLVDLSGKEDSPLNFLGLEPTELGQRIYAESTDPQYGGSIEAARSSTLGVIGDLGLVGLIALVALFFALWRRVGRSRSWLVPAARSAIFVVAVLSFLDNWLEYPEFVVPFAVLIGIVLSDVPGSNQEQSLTASS